ncbi:ABC transporter substrate-binding protein [Paenibacillus thiaminolyticus]|uniref:ABC transporter substrate-binding protein n=1 Tax=Paenibacillus thiaminolyticus TaxID=49283 RepID=A0AAP9J0P0_PANTH|nr:ABC transporter substrate-binding protein [Paenibacillus thiaminolyticus]MCY9533514.1 ABC transporter substrate-binding protein [Paenibacillus thiaminolyticus]MCY9604179.1 ABC transporter substrate-binding protein [Paenibacillus thiaminolyticus]MCY9606273.1 ABC transporter substrate-binding protein [Paenibacillus thiaminolyticus]MCY9612023.1 ABC transporter substrate-binding protein [Paenibacillus thiaminolyticus]MCY9618044.1 ABC transporter substrate-binding protein [Paenibacillus thiamino
MMKRLISVTLILVLALIFTGCGQKEGQATGSQESAAQQNEKAAEEQKSEDHQTKQQKAESTQEADFKVVNTSRGEVKIPVNPQRVVDLAYATEELLIMGIKPIMSSAGPDLPDYLKDKLEGVTLVDAGSVKVEDVMALNPDLIITSGRTEKLYDQLTQIAPTVQLEGDFYTWRERFPEMAGILGKEKEMNEWLAQYEKKAKQIGDEIKAVTGDATFALYVTNASQYRIYGKALLGDVLFSDLKLPMGEGAPTESSVEIVSLENLFKFDPDYIFLGLYGDNLAVAQKKLDDMQKSGLWGKLKAAKNGHVYMLDNSTWSLGTFPLGKEKALEMVRDMVLKK